GLARSYSSKRKGLHRSVRLRSNTCTSTTRFRKFRGTEFRALGRDSRFESNFATSDPNFWATNFSQPSFITEPCAQRVCPPTSNSKPMEQIKRNYFGGTNFEARTIKDIIEPA